MTKPVVLCVLSVVLGIPFVILGVLFVILAKARIWGGRSLLPFCHCEGTSVPVAIWGGVVLTPPFCEKGGRGGIPAFTGKPLALSLSKG